MVLPQLEGLYIYHWLSITGESVREREITSVGKDKQGARIISFETVEESGKRRNVGSDCCIDIAGQAVGISVS